MALVEVENTPLRGKNLRTQKRVRVLVVPRAVNDTFHGKRLKEGENIITIPEGLLEELTSQVEDADWGPVVERYEEQIQKLCYDRDGNKIREEETVTYNLTKAFVDQYRREPRRYKRVEVLERGIEPRLSAQDEMAVNIATRISGTSGARKGQGRKAKAGSTE